MINFNDYFAAPLQVFGEKNLPLIFENNYLGSPDSWLDFAGKVSYSMLERELKKVEKKFDKESWVIKGKEKKKRIRKENY
ncbi:MAG: hypothetical protein I3273_05155 [Candidatus Moeniiplasma glomeromycotorum]|nr:hypothetical protein [Candidatus Moeniiplasma glomeromycotorum]MCE8168302.1 hypothetical protein [Candidatus Moeniiplasma glomeromycotorum]MCE8169481.1 hypothetical protein [Candidatus Moeniiplasma glomeromycotorum]